MRLNALAAKGANIAQAEVLIEQYKRYVDEFEFGRADALEGPIATALKTSETTIPKRSRILWFGSIKYAMHLLPGGSFTMGSTDWEYSQPVHEVTIANPFYMGKYLVTQGQWETVMGVWQHLGQCKNTRGPEYPVCCVSWDDCQEFITKLKTLESATKFRLPSEAEWEYACRAGSKGRYCFGDDESKLVNFAWFAENSGNKTHPVGQLKSNAWGLYDLHGNLWEWCQDNWHDNYSNAPTDGRAWEPGKGRHGSGRVIRSGSWCDIAEVSRSARRGRTSPGIRDPGLGFRLVRDVT